MKNRIIRVTISALLLLCAFLHVPSYGVSVGAGDVFAPKQSAGGKIINHSSFVQIPKQMFNACIKVGRAFQEIMRVSFSHSETVFKAPFKIASFGIYFDTVNLREYKTPKASYGAPAVKYADSGDKSARHGLFFMVFIILQILLCLLAVKKANLPYAIKIKTNTQTRYRI